jgi:thiol-disulfide isomerase/thioredoxin
VAKRYYKVGEMPSVMVVYFDHKKQKFHRYVMPAAKWGEGGGDSSKVATLTKYVQEVLDGKGKKHYKTEEVFPKGMDIENGVQLVVGGNFHDMVYRKDRDVMLEMYSPGCHGCKAFAPVYDGWAQSEEIQGEAKLLVAKVNGGENDCPMENCEWNTYPSVYFFKVGH